MRVSICIPHSGTFFGLWATIAACKQALGVQPHEFIVCANGIELTKEHRKLDVQYIVKKELVGPATARELCAEVANGDYLYFVDDHVLTSPFLFRTLVGSGKDVAYCASHSSGVARYDYEPELSVMTQLESTMRTEPRYWYPYLCMAGSLGSYMVKRSAWDTMKGYGGIFKTYCNEEPYFGMRAWMHGLECWMYPKILNYHYSAFPPEYKNHTEEYVEQMDIALEELKNLKTGVSFDQALERLSKLNQGIVCI